MTHHIWSTIFTSIATIFSTIFIILIHHNHNALIYSQQLIFKENNRIRIPYCSLYQSTIIFRWVWGQHFQPSLTQGRRHTMQHNTALNQQKKKIYLINYIEHRHMFVSLILWNEPQACCVIKDIGTIGTQIKPAKTYMRALGANSSSSTIRPSKNYRHRYLASRHIVWFCSRINDVVNCLQR